jgi:hypothetical protein
LLKRAKSRKGKQKGKIRYKKYPRCNKYAIEKTTGGGTQYI